MTPPLLLAVPNISEGRDHALIEAIGKAFTGDGERARDTSSPAPPAESRLLDVHSDPDHHRAVYTLAASPRTLADALLNGAAHVVAEIDVMSGSEPRGQHPHVGSLDVVPIVYLDQRARGAACAEALVVADRIGSELDVPVFLYGELAAGRGRAELRRGGVRGLEARLANGARRAPGDARLLPDFGPARMHPRAGATLVAAREPLVAFNVRLGPAATLADARAIAGAIREGGAEGLPGVRAIAVALSEARVQVSMNVERPLETPLALLVTRIARRAAVEAAEVVGLAPAAALEGFPDDVPVERFDPARHVIENALGLPQWPSRSADAGRSTAATPPA
jgi:glutamate formiminotransferase/glutamate formiminotransferase/formiminotetrahydrofolate cyclodeaminase